MNDMSKVFREFAENTNQPMPQPTVTLPQEVVEQIDKKYLIIDEKQVPRFTYNDVSMFQRAAAKYWATIAAAHYQEENHRLMELMREAERNNYDKIDEKFMPFETYFEQYCKDNNLTPTE